MEEGFCICQVSYLEAQKMQQPGPVTTLGTELISMEIVINEGFKLIILHRLLCRMAAFQIPRSVKAEKLDWDDSTSSACLCLAAQHRMGCLNAPH